MGIFGIGIQEAMVARDEEITLTYPVDEVFEAAVKGCKNAKHFKVKDIDKILHRIQVIHGGSLFNSGDNVILQVNANGSGSTLAITVQRNTARGAASRSEQVTTAKRNREVAQQILSEISDEIRKLEKKKHKKGLFG